MSTPFYDEEFTFTQPDGTQIQVRGWGDQHHAVFETLDGFTLVKDPVTGYYQYATVGDDDDELRPTGVRPGIADPAMLGLQPNLRVNRAAAKALAATNSNLPPTGSRWHERRRRAKMQLRDAMLAPGLIPAPPQRDTVGDFVGLCLLVEFPDVPGTISRDEVEAFCNQSGYSGFGNRGSVNDFFSDNSLGRLNYTNIVTPYYTARHPRQYYTNEAIPQPQRAWELIKEALTHWLKQGFDFGALTSDDEDYVYALNVFYAGNRVNNWAKGLWPHSYHLLTPYQLAAGKRAFDYQITDMGSELTLSTFCHENGHMICDFPDLYDYGYESRGAGVYCLMAAGGTVNKKNPIHVGAYLKLAAGWAGNLTPITAGLQATAMAGENEFFIYRKDRSEYFIVENRQKAGRDQSLTGSGLAIWHVEELGSNNDEQMTATSHYECALEQADGRFHLEHGANNGDSRDLFRADTSARFADSTLPASKWWDGTSSGLDIHNISSAGQEMTFSADVS